MAATMTTLSVLPLLLADAGDGWGHMGRGDGWMWLWGALMMAFWIVVVGLVVLWVTRANRTPAPDPHGRAREILSERLARGEITLDEYRERTEALR